MINAFSVEVSMSLSLFLSELRTVYNGGGERERVCVVFLKRTEWEEAKKTAIPELQQLTSDNYQRSYSFFFFFALLFILTGDLS